MRLFLSAVIVTVYLSGCATLNSESDQAYDELTKFAYANCLLWYFDSKGYDTEDIRSISGGIVETSGISLEKFQEVALAVKSYTPDIETKNDIDTNLLKCFYLKDNERIKELLE